MRFAGAKELPLQLLVSDVSGALTSLPFRIETTESERLTIDHVSNATDARRSPCEHALRTRASACSAQTLHVPCVADATQLSSTAAAVAQLSERLGTLHAYVQAVSRGEVPLDCDLMGQVAAVASQVPATGGDAGLPLELRKASMGRDGVVWPPGPLRTLPPPTHCNTLQDYDDFLLLSCLSSITVGAEALHSLNRHVRGALCAAAGGAGGSSVWGQTLSLTHPPLQAQQAGLGQQRFVHAGGGGRVGGAGGMGLGDRADFGGSASLSGAPLPGGNRRRRQPGGASGPPGWAPGLA